MTELIVGLHAVVIAVTQDEPRVLLSRSGEAPLKEGLPFGRLDLDSDATLELGLRRSVRELSGLVLGYVEQLYTFGDRVRGPERRDSRVLSIGYLALAREFDFDTAVSSRWASIYDLFAWEDWRLGEPSIIPSLLLPELEAWCERGEDLSTRRRRAARTQMLFGRSDAGWNLELVLERFELLYEAGLVSESIRDTRDGTPRPNREPASETGRALRDDDRRIVATALGRLRGKIRYRPLVFELMPDIFTLLQLQRVVETLSGTRLHKQNFRRVLEKARLVEGTGTFDRTAGGRPAECFRFREEVIHERKAPGVGLPVLTRSSRASE